MILAVTAAAATAAAVGMELMLVGAAAALGGVQHCGKIRYETKHGI